MDDTRFDNLARAFGTLANRRLTLGALLGGALSLHGLADSEAAKSGKCKPTCGDCQSCKKGKCRRTNSGKKKCKKGKCQPKADETPCQGGTGQCLAGNCIVQQNPPPPPPPPPPGVCLAIQQACQVNTQCCPNLICGKSIANNATDRCCQGPGTPCSSGTAANCCTTLCNTDTAQCFCKGTGDACNSNSQCCSSICQPAGTCL